MPSYGNNSRDNLSTCHRDLQRLFNEVIKHYDCSVICGYRDRVTQELAVKNNASTKHFPYSKHNQYPSIAVDVIPYPVDWKDMEQFRHFAGFVEGMAASMEIKIRSGGDWDSDRDFDDQRFIDMPHWELIGV